jgi:hypothetical protein
MELGNTVLILSVNMAEMNGQSIESEKYNKSQASRPSF